MLSINEIKKYYPNLTGFSRDILREYLQYKILDIIFKTEIGNKLSFIGGTAIKLGYNSSRFSEDLDFDNFGLTSEDFIRLSDIIRRELELEGYIVEVSTTFKEAFRANIKILNLLQENGLSNAKEEKILIQVDTYPHSFVYKPTDFLLQKFDTFRNIKLTPADILLSMKVACIFGRKRMKGRDFYDLVYLLGQADFNYAYLDFKLNIKTASDLKTKLLESIADLDLNLMAKDVQPFLIKSDDQRLVLSFREYLEQKLK